MASALSSGNYDQVFLWDLTSSSYLNAADLTALDSFWNASMGVVVDMRSYGYYYQGGNPSEVALLRNVAEALDLSGGGIWIGSDHNPAWTANANPVLSTLGFDQITGSFSDPVNFGDTSSFLLDGVTPADLWAAGQSVGQAPIGVQPNGLEMFIHFGHVRNDGSVLPYISANFDLEGPTEQPSGNVPEPTTISLLVLGLTGLLISKHTEKKLDLG